MVVNTSPLTVDVDPENRRPPMRENLRGYVAGEKMLSVADVARAVLNR